MALNKIEGVGGDFVQPQDVESRLYLYTGGYYIKIPCYRFSRITIDGNYDGNPQSVKYKLIDKSGQESSEQTLSGITNTPVGFDISDGICAIALKAVSQVVFHYNLYK